MGDTGQRTPDSAHSDGVVRRGEGGRGQSKDTWINRGRRGSAPAKPTGLRRPEQAGRRAGRRVVRQAGGQASHSLPKPGLETGGVKALGRSSLTGCEGPGWDVSQWVHQEECGFIDYRPGSEGL